MNEMLLDSSLVLERAADIPASLFNEREYDGPWWAKFYDPDGDKYDWNDPEWVARNKGSYAFRVIPLTQGYFMIVSKRDYNRMTRHKDGRPKKWHVQRQLDEFGEVIAVYACRRGRGDEPKTVFAHREILRCIDAKGDVDHVNGFSLDNRDKNLILGPRRHNNRNTAGNRRKNLHLLPGVEERGKNRKGQILYGGIRSRRVSKKGKGSVRTFRTKQLWLSQTGPNRWYLNQIKRLSKGRAKWAHAPKTVNFPVFPPLMESEPTEVSVQLRQKAVPRRKISADIPF